MDYLVKTVISQPVVTNEACRQACVIIREKHLLTNTISQVLGWSDLRG
jgi:hypothetical protein